MLLSAEKDEKLNLIMLDDAVPAGAKLCQKNEKSAGYDASSVSYTHLCLLKPFVWAKILVKKIIDFAKKVFQYYRKWGKIKYHRLSVTSGRNKPAEKRKEQTEIEAQKGRYFYENHHSGSAGVRGGVPHPAAGKNRGRKGRAARAAAGDRR